ncbi:MAG: hypothetical protein V4671_29600 [Armatimonadota bacterium]
MEIRAAERYEVPQDLWTITCVFNPSGYRTKMENYHRFAQKFRDSGLPLLTVQCAFSGEPFILPDAPDIVSVRSDSILWQKERLLNVALSHLPLQAKKVVWIDGDLLFSNPEWAVETSKVLDTFPAAQPFQQWCRLPENELVFRGEGETGESFTYQYRKSAAEDDVPQGFPGFAWAARRDVLEKHGFYDACIIGGGDNMMAHALSGDTAAPRVQRILGVLPEKRLLRRLAHPFARPSRYFADHYERWAAGIHADVQGNLGSVPGHLLHLWHGSMKDRRYRKRHDEMARFGYNPETDLWKNSDGAWEWSEKRADMRRWAEDYFRQRKEDG